MTKKKSSKKRRTPKLPSVRTMLRRSMERSKQDAKTIMDLQKSVAQLQAQIPSKFVWTTGNGLRMDLTMMDDSHLQNAICYVQRTLVHALGTTVWLAKAEEKCRALYEMLKEARRRGLAV
jgi:hypothetical protein